MKKLVSLFYFIFDCFFCFFDLILLLVHRLTAALAFFIRLSPQYETQIKPLMEVLNTRKLLKDKLVKGPGWNIDGGIGKKEIRKLVEEVAMKLCP